MDGLNVRNLSKTYDKKKYALNNVSLGFPDRGVLAVIGRNGAGKTTLVRILATELMPTRGSATINGIDVIKNPAQARESMAIVPQEARTTPWMTPKQQVLSYLLYRGFSYADASKRASKALEEVGLKRYENTLSMKLSGGTKRKVLVATVLASEANVIFLDEPTTGLDPISRVELWNLLVRLKERYMIVLTTHYLEEAERLADRIVMIEDGKVVAYGSMDDLRKKAGQEYSVRITDAKMPRLPKSLKAAKFSGGYQILTSQKKAFELSNKLMKEKIRFSTNPVSLEDLFYYFAKKSINEDAEEQGESGW